jgi:integrase/recombinase XerC
MQVRRAIEVYLVQLRADGLAESTLQQASAHLHALSNALGPRRDVRTVTPETLAAFLVTPSTLRRPDGKPKLVSSMNILRSRMRCFFRYLYDAGHLDRDPGRLIRRARCAPPPPKALSPEDEQRLRATLAAAQGDAAGRDRMLVALMLGSGLRLGAALSLAVEDLELDRGEAHVRRDKGNRSEIVVLPPWVVAVLREGLAERTRGPLFPGAHGILTARQARCRIAEWGRRAGLRRRLSPHQLRHTMGSRLYERTGDVLLVQAALHHRSIQSSTVYASCTAARLRQALAGPT